MVNIPCEASIPKNKKGVCKHVLAILSTYMERRCLVSRPHLLKVPSKKDTTSHLSIWFDGDQKRFLYYWYVLFISRSQSFFCCLNVLLLYCFISEDVKFSGGGTSTRLALDLVNEKVVNETRKDSKKVLFLVTDGNYNIGGDPSGIAAHLRRNIGYEIYTLGISDSVKREHLEKIASLPFATHIYMLKDFGMLDKLKELVNKTTIGKQQLAVESHTKTTLWPWERGC